MNIVLLLTCQPWEQLYYIYYHLASTRGSIFSSSKSELDESDRALKWGVFPRTTFTTCLFVEQKKFQVRQKNSIKQMKVTI